MKNDGTPRSILRKALALLLSVSMVTSGIPTTAIAGALEDVAPPSTLEGEDTGGSTGGDVGNVKEDDVSPATENADEERGQIGVRLELADAPPEAADQQFSVAVQDADGRYLQHVADDDENDSYEFVDEECALDVVPSQTLTLTGLAAGTYSVRVSASEYEPEGYSIDEESSVLQIEVEVAAGEMAEATLVVAFQAAEEADEGSTPADEPAEEERAEEEAAEEEDSEEQPADEEQAGQESPTDADAASDVDDEDDFVDRQETADLNLLLDAGSLTITAKGVTYNLADLDGQSVKLEKNEPFMLHLAFAETDAYGFVKDDTVLLYTLPDGVTLPETFTGSEFSVDCGDGITLDGNRVTYDREKNQLQIHWNTDDAEGMDALYASAEAMIQFDIEAQVDEKQTQIEFSDELTVDLTQDETHSAEVEKTGTYNRSTNQVDYTVTVTSIGNNQDVEVVDKITGSALSYDWDEDSPTKTSVSYAGDADSAPRFSLSDTSDKGFTLTVDSLKNGETFTFTYSANVDTSKLDYSGVQVARYAGNQVTVLGVTTPAPETLIDWSDISKSGWVDTGKNTIDSRTVTWQIVTNDARVSSFAGSDISDAVAADVSDRMYYTGDGLTIEVYDKDNKLVDTRTLTWAEVGVSDTQTDQAWTYTVPDDDDIYKYVVTYQTIVSLEDKNESFRVSNAAMSRAGEATGFVDLGPGVGETITYEKSVANVTQDYVDWDIKVFVPDGSYWATNRFVITDTLPSKHIDGTWYYDLCDTEDGSPKLALEPTYEEDGSSNVIGQTASAHGEYYKIATVDPSGSTGQQVVITFYHLDHDEEKTGLSSEAGARTIYLQIRSYFSEDWLDQSAGTVKDRQKLTHTNSVTVNNYGAKSASAYIARTLMKKELIPLGEDENGDPVYMGTDEDGMPYYKFRLTMQGITKAQLTEPIVLQDDFNATNGYFAYCADATTVLQGGNDDTDLTTLKTGPFGDTTSGFFAQTTDTGVRFTLASLDGLLDTANGNTPYGTYAIDYKIKVKDADALSALNKQSIDAHDEGEEGTSSGAIPMTNKISGYGNDGSVDFSYEYKPVSKDVTIDTDSDNVATYTITVNPDKYMLNNGESMELTDTFSENQSVQYDTIQVVATDKNGNDVSDSVTWDYRGYTGTYVIPDETAVTITYRTTLLPGTNQTYTNLANMKGYSSTAQKTMTVKTSGSGSAKSYKIRLFKYANGIMGKGLEGATFQLLDAKGRVMTYRKDRTDGVNDHAKGVPVTFTTDESGYATIFLHMGKDGVALRKNTVYYLEEIVAPEGYVLDKTQYSFMISDDPNYTSDPSGVWVYHSNDILKVRNQKLVEGGLKVVKRFVGTAELTSAQKRAVTITIEYKDDDHSDWTTLKTLHYGDEGFEDGAYELTTTGDDPEYQMGRTYRVTETSADIEGYMRTTSYVIDTSASVTVESDDQIPTQEITDDNVDEHHTIVVTNDYFRQEYDFTKLDSSTGELVPGAEFAACKATDETVVHTYKTDKNGSFTITQADGYDQDVLYYVVETKAPNAYVQPSQLSDEAAETYFQKHYFYFSDGSMVPEGLPSGAEAVNLYKTYGSEDVVNEKTFRTTASIEATKQADKLLAGLSFSFELLDAEGKVVATKTATQGGTAFLNQTYTTADLYDASSNSFLDQKTWTYTLREVIPEGAQAYDADGNAVANVTYGDETTDEQRTLYTWKLDGVTYSTKQTSVTVTVTRSDDEESIGKLSATVAYGSPKGSDAPGTSLVADNEFRNAYEAKGEAEAEVSKKLTGKALAEGQFAFTLVGTSDAPIRVETLSGDASVTALFSQKSLHASNDASGAVSFDTLHYTEDNLDPDSLSQTYVYKISEDSFSYPGISRDTSAGPSDIYAQVKLTDDRKGNIATEVTYFKDAACTQELTDDDIAFVNKYEATGKLTLTANKTFVDGYWPQGTTTYRFITKHDTSDGYNSVAPSFSNMRLRVSFKNGQVTTTLTGGSADFSLANLAKVASDSDEDAPAGYVSSRTFKYTISEQKPSSTKGVTYDDRTIAMELTIADDGQGHIKVRSLTLNGTEMVSTTDPSTINVTPGGSLPSSFQNDYDAKGSYDLEVAKSISGDQRVWLDDDSFEFTLEPVTDGAPMSADPDLQITNATANHIGVYSLPEVTLDDIRQGTTNPATKTYKYKVYETIPEGAVSTEDDLTYGAETSADDRFAHDWVKDGITYTGAPHQIAITFTDRGDGTITATMVDKTVDEDKTAASVSFDNHYKADGEAQVSITKNLTGWQLANADNQEFTFTLSPVTSGAPMRHRDADGNVTTVTSDVQTITLSKGTGIAEFGKLYYNTDDDLHGSFVYKITEALAAGVTSPNGITLADPIYVKVDLSQDDWHGNLTPKVTYYKDAACKQELSGDDIAFENTYEPHGSLTLTADKVFEHNYWPNGNKKTGAYTFQVTPEDPNAPTFSNIVLTVTSGGVGDNQSHYRTTGGEGTFELKHLLESDDRYVSDKTYTYQITEVQVTPANGVTYSDRTIPMELTIHDDGEGHISVVSLKVDGVEKSDTIVGKDANGVGGTFDVTPGATNSFQNSYDAEGDGQIKVRKLLAGREWKTDETYGFTLKPATGSLTISNPAEGSTTNADGSVTIQVGKGGAQSFGIIHAKLADLATDGVYASSKSFAYQILESVPAEAKACTKDGDLIESVTHDYQSATDEEKSQYNYWIHEGVVYDSTPRDVILTFTDVGDGNLAFEVTEKDSATSVKTSGSSFNNAYHSKGTATLEVTKSFGDQSWPGSQTFTFDLASTNGSNLPQDATDATTTAVTCTSAERTQSFGTITYTQDDMKNASGAYVKEKDFTYTVTERVPSDTKGVTYDTKAHTVTVHVVDNQDGTISTSYSWDAASTATDGDVTISNSYDASTSLTLRGTKSIDVEDVSAAGFGFTLKPTGNKVVEGHARTTTSGTDGSFAFDSLGYTLDDIKTQGTDGKWTYPDTTFTYTISENDPSTNKPGFQKTDSATDVTVSVLVHYDADTGVLSATPTYKRGSQDLSAVTFVNTYEAKGSIVFKGTKTIDVSDRAIQKGEVFNFTIKEGDTEVATGTSDAEGNITFEPISYELNATADDRGTHTYTISEDSFDKNGVTSASQSQTIRVSVADAHDGTLTATVLDGRSRDTIDFQNTYASSTSITFEGTKTIDKQRAIESGEVFTFLVEEVTTSEDGKTTTTTEVGTATSDANGNITYPTITYKRNAGRDDRGIHTYRITEQAYGTTNGVTSTNTVRIVKVSVTDDDLGNLVATQAQDSQTDVYEVDFENTYTAEGTLTLEGTKAITNQPDTMSLAGFKFTVKEGTKPVTTGTSQADGSIAFDTITYSMNDLQKADGTYDTSKTLTYVITEDGDTKDGVTNSTDQITVEVTLTNDQHGTITATPTYKLGDATLQDASFTNTYSAKGTLTLEGSKAITNKPASMGLAGFKFTVKEGETEVATGESQADGTIAFKPISYELPTTDPLKAKGRHTYTITEDQTPTREGVTNQTAPVTVTVDVTDDGKGHLVASAVQGSVATNAVDFTNTYVASGTADFWVQKVLTGRALNQGEFSFTLSGRNVAGAEHADGSETVTNAAAAAGQTVQSNFATVAYTLDDLMANADGSHKDTTYTYILRENKPDSALGGVTYDETLITMEVTLHDEGDGTISTTTKTTYSTSELFGNARGYTFQNTYEASGEAKLSARKAANADLRQNEFRFQLLDESGAVLQTSDPVGEGETAAFEPIEYTLEDLGGATEREFTYQIREVVPEDAKDRVLDGITYSDDVQTVKVKVADDGRGTLVVTYDGSAEFAPHVFSNAYEATGTLPLSGTKSIDSRKFGLGDSFTFQVLEVKGDEETEVSTTTLAYDAEKTTGKTADIPYAALSYTYNAQTPDVLGTHAYVVRETAASSRGGAITKSATEHRFSVLVEDNGDGTLKLTRTGDDPAELDFENAYEAQGSLTFLGTKRIDTRAIKAGETFHFVVKENGTTVAEGNSDDKGIISYSTITYQLNAERDDTGTHHYVVSEEFEDAAGVKKDSRTYEFDVVVSDKGDGTLNIQAPDLSKHLDFVNTYEATGKAQFAGTKTIDSRPLNEGERYNFTVIEKEDGTPTGRSWTVTNDDAGTIAFPEITYDISCLIKGGQFLDQRVYTYEVAEADTTRAGVTKDSGTYTVTVTVTDNKDGTLSASATYPEAAADGKLDFQNAYVAEGSATVHGTKSIDADARADKSLEGKFTFELYEGGREEGETPLQTVRTGEDGTFSFAAIAYRLERGTEATVGTKDEPKVYTYTLHEVPVDGYTPVADQTITVEVWDEGDGALHVTSSVPETTAGIELTNVHEASGSIALAGTKAVDTRALQEGETYEFVLTDTFGGSTSIIGTYTNDSTGAIDFPASIAYTHSAGRSDVGTHVYQVREVEKDGNGVTSSRVVHSFEVVVADDGDSTLAVTRTGDDPQQLDFQNHYDATGSVSFSGTKHVDGRSVLESDKAAWTFTIEPEGDAPLRYEAVSGRPERHDKYEAHISSISSGDGTFLFPKLYYTLEDLKNDDDTYAEEKTFSYRITETGEVDHVTNEKDAATTGKIVQVKVSQHRVDGKVDGTLDVAIVGGTDNPTFQNTYAASGTIDIPGSKTLTGRKLKDDDPWYFSIAPAEETGPVPHVLDAEGEPATEPRAYITSDTTDDVESWDYNFKLGYTLDDLRNDDGSYDRSRTFSYVVTEHGEAAGVTNDAHNERYVAVRVTDPRDGSGTLEVELLGRSEGLTYENDYDATGETTIRGTKVLEGRDFKAGDVWRFTISSDDPNAPLPEQKTVEVDATEDANFTLGPIAYTEVDVDKTYTYTITESGVVSSVQNDESPKEVTVTVTDNGDGTLTVVSSTDEEPTTFTNTYLSTEVRGHKVWEDDEEQTSWTRPDSIEVKLQAKGASGEWADFEGQTATVTGDDWAYAFTGLPQYDGDVEYEYRVVEVEVPEGYVESGGTEDDEYVLTNTIEGKRDAEEPVTLTVCKTGVDEELLADATFTLTASDGTTTDYVTGADGTVDIVFTTTGTWTLQETKAPAGYLLNDQVYNIEVTRNGIKSITYDKGDTIWTWLYNLIIHADFDGTTLTVPDEQTLVKVSKVSLTDRSPLAGANLRILDADGEEVERWTSTDEAHEIKGLVTGVTYTLEETAAPTGYTVAATATFSIDSAGNITSSGTVDADGTLVVVDAESELKGTATLQASKLVWGEEGWDEDEEFNFALAKVDPATTDVITADTVAVKAGDTGSFGEITYLEEGTYEYTISEVVGDTEYMTYDPAIFHARVVVSKNADRTALETSVQYSADGSTWTEDVPVFNNTYGGRIDKFVNGSSHADTENLSTTFTYDLVAFVTNDAMWINVIDELPAGLEMVSAADDVVVEDIGTTNNHLEHGTVDVEGTPINRDYVDILIYDNTLDVFIWGFDDIDGVDMHGHWIRVRFEAKLDGTTNASSIMNVAQYDVYDQERNDDDMPDPIHGGRTPYAGVSFVTKVPVQKKWQNADGTEAAWPEGAEVSVALLADGQETGETLTLTAENTSGAFENVPIYDNTGKEITYTIAEASVTGAPEDCTTATEGSAADGYVITNTLPAPTTSVAFQKVWHDAEGNEADWPEGAIVTVELLANGEALDPSVTMELTEEQQSGEFTELPAGGDVTYTVREAEVKGADGYTSEVTGDAEQGFVITNTPEPAEPEKTTSISVQKVWTRGGEKIDWPEGAVVSVELLADGESMEPKRTVELTEDETSATFEGVPASDYVVYTVAEVEVSGADEGYVASVAGNATDGYTISNDYASTTPEKPTDDEDTPKPGNPSNPSNESSKSQTAAEKSATKSTSAAATTRSSTPKTADATTSMAWLAYAGMAMAFGGLTMRRRRKE